LPATAYDLLTEKPKLESFIAGLIGGTPLVLGNHFFVTSPSGSGLSPFFDFTKSQKSKTAFVLAAKAGDIASPGGSVNIDWLKLTNVQGSLAKDVFRVDTQHGQPPASCTVGSPLISVPYVAVYWFYD